MHKSPLLVAAFVALFLLAVVLSTRTPPTNAPSPRSHSPAAVAESQAGAPSSPGFPDTTALPRSAFRPNPAASPLALPTDFPAPLDPLEFVLDLPAGQTAHCIVERHETDEKGTLTMVDGRVSFPAAGRFFFRRQPPGTLPGPIVGFLYFPGESFAYAVETTPGGRSVLAHRPADAVACIGYAPPFPDEPEQIPADHPTDIPIPDYQNGVIPLESLPGATGVIYLDYDGEEGPHSSWGDFDAASFNASNSQIKQVWERVAEDFAPFNLNVTTDLQVYLDAPETSRQRVIVTPTTDAAPGAGGVAYLNSFNWSGDTPCWAFYGTGKSAAEVISHEIGHTLRLRHDGQDPSTEYYRGHGDGDVGWGPIMGVGYYENLTQWSKGEYLDANRTEDDLFKITEENNLVDYRTDDHGGDHAGASPIDFSSGNVDDEGVIEQDGDVDAFRFSTSTGGAINLSIDPVNRGPNLDILAEIYDDSGTLLDSHNPDLQLDATLTTNIPAGSFTVRVTNTGRGDPLGDGYTSYASLGEYTITGTIPGVVLPDQFTVDEHAPNTTLVGTVAARENHGAATLTWSMSGDLLGLFTIDPSNGDITVANSALLDFESLSSGWNDPAVYDLEVTIDDSLDPQLDESIRVVVTVANINEAPSLSGGSLTMLEHTRVGRSLLTLSGTDPDAFDQLTYAITAGDPSGRFAIDNNGVLGPAADLDASVQSVYNLTVTASDSGSPALTDSATVTINLIDTDEGYEPGGLFHTFYRGISGNNISDLTASPDFPLEPSDEDFRDEIHANGDGDNYGRTARAYLLPPLTGDYTFYIAGDDSCELLLSTDADPGNATVIASFSGYTDYQQWTKFGGQQSAVVSLTAGTAYYLEARQKEGTGGDHLSVAWEIDGPGGGTNLVPLEPIPGLFLAPHVLNYPPGVADRSATLRANAFAGSPVIAMTATDTNAGDTATFAITGGNPDGAFAIDSATGKVRIADTTAFGAAGSHVLTITATDSGTPALSASGTLTVTVAAANTITATSPLLEIWDGIGGTSLSSLTNDGRFPDRPDRLVELSTLDSGTNYGDNYGARIRAILTPDTGDNYVFHLASDDNGSLLLSSDHTAGNASPIAGVPGWTNYKQWDKFPGDQASDPVTLVAGQPRFIEARFKEGGGGDHVAVAWTNSTITDITIVDGAQLAPYDSNVAPALTPLSPVVDLPASPGAGTSVANFTATDAPFEDITFGILSGDPAGAFAIDPTTGAVTVANPGALGPGPYTLEVAAQDSGHGGYFPLRSGSTSATVYLGDTDHDHLPDAWEIAQFGNLASSGSDDNDGDGESNYTAFLFQSDPTDPDSLPAAPTANGLSSPAGAGDTTYQFTFTVRRNLLPGAYQLQRSGDLSSWTDLTPGTDAVLVSVTPVDADFETHVLEVTVPDDTVFLRAATTSP